ncbi:MAG: TonB-dependent receptor plug domain-containing protein [Mangrovibacterium sp.]
MLLAISFAGMAQEKTISAEARKQPLSEVLEQVSATYDVSIAFDADYFSKIEATFVYREVSLTHFLDELCKKHHLLYEKIGATFVIYANPAPTPVPPPEYIQLRGQVIDRESGEPLLFCNIGLGENKGTTTNELGIFNEKTEKEEQITLSISHLGYHRLDTVINLSETAFHTIRLTPFSVHLEAIQVYQQEKEVIEMGDKTGRLAFNPKQSAHLPRVDDSDLLTALSLIPGVNFLGGQSSGISIRGSSPSENLILLDGIPVLETSHLFGNLSVLNAKFITQAFVSRGAFDATYGERTSGIVELTGRSSYLKPGLDLSANLLNVSAAANLPISQKISVSGAYRKSYIDQWENYLYEQILRQQSNDSEDGATVEPSVVFDDLNLKISVKPDEKQEISVNFLESNDLQNRDFQFKETSRFFREENSDSKNRGISANWRYQSGNWHHHLNVGYNELTRSAWSYAGMGPNSQGKGGKEELDSDNNYLEELMASWSGELKTGKFTHQAGFGLHKDQVSYDYRAERTVGNIQIDSINNNTQTTILHGYWQEKIQLGNQLQLRAGIRGNHESTTGKLYLQPRAGIYLDLQSGIQLFYSGGVYNQFLSRIRKIDSSGNSDLVWYLPDSIGLGTLKAIQHVAGAGFEKNGLVINLEAYYKKTTGKVNLYAEMSGKKEKTIEYILHEGQSESFGLDALLHYKQGSLTHMLATSVSKTTEQFSDFNNDESYPSFDDQRLRLRWTEMFRHRGWVLATNLTLRSGSPYLVQSPETGNTEFSRLPYFAQTDFSVMKRFTSKYISVSAGLSLLNLFNRQNVVEVDYFNISDATGTYSLRTDVTAMKFTPVFFINIKTL